jgi:hypothetical protein
MKAVLAGRRSGGIPTEETPPMRRALPIALGAVLLLGSAEAARAQYRTRVWRVQPPAVAYRPYGAVYYAPNYRAMMSVPYQAGPTVNPGYYGSTYYYGTYGFPNYYYTPTYQGYAPYVPPATTYTGGQPVYSTTYHAPGAPVQVTQGYTGRPTTTAPSYSGYGYPSYGNPGQYLYGQNLTSSPALPGYTTYGQSTQATLTPPGYYGNYVATPSGP